MIPIVFLIDVDNTRLDNDRIGDLLDYDRPALLANQQAVQISLEVTR